MHKIKRALLGADPTHKNRASFLLPVNKNKRLVNINGSLLRRHETGCLMGGWGRYETDLYGALILRNNFGTEWPRRLDIGTEEDSIHQLDRAAQVTIFRLRSGHCQLLSHLHRLNISHSDECPCGTGAQTPNHILQSCPTFDTLRRQTWPSPVDAHRKLWGPVEALQQTAVFTLLAGLKI